MKQNVKPHGMRYQTIEEIRGPLLIIEGVKGAAYNERVEVTLSSGRTVSGTVLETHADKAIVQVFGKTDGLSLDSSVRFTGRVFQVPLSPNLIGRVFDGNFEPLDDLPEPIGEEEREVHYSVINPAAREPPSEFIQTGISAIDGMNSLVRGQKLPIFSETGLPHNRIAAQIARQATVLGKEEEFAIVFCAMGIKNEEYRFFREEFRETGALNRSVMVLNLADDPTVERILAPRIALTVSEYLAFEQGMHILVIMTDMTKYGEALRQNSIAREEIPARKGYPGYLYSDLAEIYERAGKLKDREGSITLMPILTMPGGDMTHPIPDLTGYITEGQLILERDLQNRGIYPPMNVLPSLSRLMKDGIGEGKTRVDHPDVQNQLYSSYSEGVEARRLSRIVGEVGLSERERQFLQFARKLENEFVNQGRYENRSIEKTLEISWELLSLLPKEELVRIDPRHIEDYYP